MGELWRDEYFDFSVTFRWFIHSSVLSEDESPLIENEHRESNELGKTNFFSSINSVWFRVFLLVNLTKTIDIICRVDVSSKQCNQQWTECILCCCGFCWKRNQVQCGNNRMEKIRKKVVATTCNGKQFVVKISFTYYYRQRSMQFWENAGRKNFEAKSKF